MTQTGDFKRPKFREFAGGTIQHARYAEQAWEVRKDGDRWLMVHRPRHQVPYVCLAVYDTIEEAKGAVYELAEMVRADAHVFERHLPDWGEDRMHWLYEVAGYDSDCPSQKRSRDGWLWFLKGVGARRPVVPVASPFSCLPHGTKFGELIGWRAWRVTILPEGPRLQSSYKETVWTSGTVTAEDGACNSGDVFDDKFYGQTVLGGWHGGGWYAYKTASQLAIESMQETELMVAGDVEMWGRVFEHEKGYRAECMRIRSLIAIGPRAELLLPDLRAFYLRDVPVLQGEA